MRAVHFKHIYISPGDRFCFDIYVAIIFKLDGGNLKRFSLIVRWNREEILGQKDVISLKILNIPVSSSNTVKKTLSSHAKKTGLLITKDDAWKNDRNFQLTNRTWEEFH